MLHIGYWRYMLVMVAKDYFAPTGLGFLVGAGPRVTLRSTLGYPISPRWGFGKVDCLPGPTLGAQDKLPYRHVKTGCTRVPHAITRPPFATQNLENPTLVPSRATAYLIHPSEAPTGRNVIAQGNALG